MALKMKAAHICLILHLILTVSVPVDTSNPITAAVGVIASLWQKTFDYHENCDSKWISFNAEGENIRHVNMTRSVQFSTQLLFGWTQLQTKENVFLRFLLKFHCVLCVGLRAALESKLIGQHIASAIILEAVNGFVNDNNPKRPLVLFLHGPTGTGKNFVSKLIADSIYKKGSGSKFVHIFASQLHFPHPSHIDTYKVWL